MSKKPSLGHNPLAYSLKSHASFDFIRSSDERKKPEKVRDVQPQKKVTSYYLEESVVDKIRSIAEEKSKSFSCVANEFLRASIEREEASE